MFAILFTLVLLLIILGAVVCFAVDVYGVAWTAGIKNAVVGLLLALFVAVAVPVSAAVISNPSHEQVCNSLEKYSAFWYAFGCFIYEGSS